MRILYHISIDDRFKGMFVYTDCIPQVQRDPLKSHFKQTGGIWIVEFNMQTASIVLKSQVKLCLCLFLANANAVWAQWGGCWSWDHLHLYQPGRKQEERTTHVWRWWATFYSQMSCCLCKTTYIFPRVDPSVLCQFWVLTESVCIQPCLTDFWFVEKTKLLVEKSLFACVCLREWVKDAYEESSEDERLPSDEDDQKHLTAWRTNQTTVHSELLLPYKKAILLTKIPKHVTANYFYG